MVGDYSELIEHIIMIFLFYIGTKLTGIIMEFSNEI